MAEGKDVAPAADVAVLLQRLTEVAAELSRAFAGTSGLDHTAGRAVLELMRAAEEGEPMTAGRLAVVLGLSPATVTALVDRLVAAGHVRRETDPRDRRRVLLVVEPAAVELGTAWFGPLGDDLAERTSRYDRAELQVVRRFLTEATEAVETHLRHHGAGPG